MQIREKGLSPRRAPRRSLLPLSPKRTQVRLKSLLYFVWLTPDPLRTPDVLWGKSAVCGLNGHRLYYIISLFKVTYKSTIQVSRNFHALFTKTLENSDTLRLMRASVSSTREPMNPESRPSSEQGLASAEQRAKGLTDFNDLAIHNPEVVSRQLDEVLQGVREQGRAATQSVELAP